MSSKSDQFKIKSPLFTDKNNNCFVCGKDNEQGLRLKDFIVEDQTIYTDIILGEKYSGFPGIIHGGIQSTIMDELMAWTIFVFENKIGITMSMKMKFKKPLLVNRKFRASAHIINRTRKVLIIKSFIKVDDEIITEGEGQYMVLSQDKAKIVLGADVDMSRFDTELIEF